MSRRNKYHTYPYLVLLIIHTALLIITFYKHKDQRRLFMLLISNISLAYLFEYFIVNIFSAYLYKPSLLKNRTIDNIAGAIFSQAIFVPFTAIFITAFQLGWYGKVVFSLYFTVVEMLFVRIGVYTHHWWKTLYTFLLLPFYFWISDKWYQHLKQGNPFVLSFSLFHLIFTTDINLLFLKAIRRKIKFGIGHFHSWREHFILVPLYSFFLSFLTTWFTKENKGLSKIWIISFRVLMDFILIKLNWLKLNKDSILSNLPFHLFMTAASHYYRKLVYKNP